MESHVLERVNDQRLLGTHNSSDVEHLSASNLSKVVAVLTLHRSVLFRVTVAGPSAISSGASSPASISAIS